MTDTIRLSALEREFQRGETAVRALRGLDLTIAPGSFVALVGPSGSGKSTLLNLLGGLDRPSAGEVWLNGLALHDADGAARTRHRRHQVGFIFQSFNLLPRLTALENVAVPLMLAGVPPAQRRAKARALLERVGLGHRLDHYPAELSGGEQQRTAVARALIHEPALILADEPTGNLDTDTGQSVMELLRELNDERGITLIVVTHDLDVAAYADRIVHLRDGRIAEIEEKVERPAVEEETAVVAPSGGGLSLRDTIQAALRNLGRRPVRNVLTVGGVLIGIITLVAMVSFGVGVQREVQRNFETIGLENIFVQPQFEEEEDGFDPFARPDPETPITPALVEEIRQLDRVESATPRLSVPDGVDLTLSYQGDERPVRISEAPPFQFGPPGTTDIVAGRDFADGESQGAILVEGLAENLLAEGETYQDLLGEQIALTARLPRGETEEFTTTIIGVRGGFGQRSLNVGVAEREAIKVWWYGQPDILQTEGYDSVIVRAASLSAVTPLSEALTDLNLRPQSVEGILEVANQVLSLLQALLGSVGGLALLVAALGVANTMMMAIYERTREIGVLKALGASPGEIRRLFTVEASFIGLMGGVFGLILGALLGRLVDWIAHRYLINEGVTGVGLLSVVPWWLALGALAFATLIGILAGLYPAARAARLDPVTALRHE